MSWHAERFEEMPGRVRFDCIVCARPMWFPKCKAGKYKTCTDECRDKHRADQIASRQKLCKTCGAVFVPRHAQIRNGVGLYCSQACNVASRTALNSEEAKARAVANRRESVSSGRVKIPRGEDHPSWRGGPEASRQRQLESGVLRQRTAEYRKRNPHKVREFDQRRKGKKTGRLPRGTVERIGGMQRWKCACCRVGIKDKYHVDHIMPLAKGGKHEPANIQLLCPRCNVRKSAKLPEDFMRQNGYLL